MSEAANATPSVQSERGWGKRFPWGLAWGLGWGTLLSLAGSLPGFYRMERSVQSLLLRSRPPQPMAEEVVVVGIDGRVEIENGGGLQTADFLLDRGNYAALTLHLIEEADASVVVLNLPSSFVVPQTLGNVDLDADLRQIIQRYPNRIVLATRSSESFRQTEINIYNHFLPFSSLLLEYLIPPEEVQGVVQFRSDIDGILRRAQLWGDFRRRDSQRTQTFASVEALAFVKLQPQRSDWLFELGQDVLFNPLGPGDRIPHIPIEDICSTPPMGSCEGQINPEVLSSLQGKVVLVGFVGGYPETFPVLTATGEGVAAVELQAQILSSLLLGDFFQSLPRWADVLIIQMAALSTGWVLSSRSWRTLRRRGSLVMVVALGYGAWGVAQFWAWKWIWPLALPIVSTGLTALGTVLTMVLLQNRERLQSQQAELEQMRRAEQEAAVDQARKLLYRVATDIHDQELQELKLVMDDLEVLQWKQEQGIPIESKIYDQLLQQLEQMGRGIRDQLNDVRTLATKLHISPNLREGLHHGIDIYLDSLLATEVLTLPVERHLSPLQESSTGAWIDHREDIMRFFREAIANVISHVQPPKGSASFVKVVLSQTGSQCYLAVSNDGSEHAPNRRGGYGTKAMNTIALDLPQGSWQRIHQPDGITLVELHWQMF